MKKISLIFLAIAFLGFCLISCEKREEVKPYPQVEKVAVNKNLTVENAGVKSAYKITYFLEVMAYNKHVATTILSNHPSDIIIQHTIIDLDSCIYQLEYGGGKIGDGKNIGTGNQNQDYEISYFVEQLEKTKKDIIDDNYPEWPVYLFIIRQLEEDIYLLKYGG